MYLTYPEFTNILPNSVSEDSFKKLISKAEIQIDTVTNYFYGMPNSPVLSDDGASEYPWINARAKAFKRAIALTIDYMDRNSVTDSSDLNNDSYSSVEIGRTTLQSANSDGSSSTGSGFAIPDEALILLGRFGLRYGGVASV